MDTSLMILHLLLGLKSLLTFESIALELKALTHCDVVQMDFLSSLERAVPDLACLHEAFNSALVSKVGTSKFCGLRFF